MEIFNAIVNNICKESSYKSKRHALKDYKIYLKEIAKLYTNTRVITQYVLMEPAYGVKNLEQHLEGNPILF